MATNKRKDAAALFELIDKSTLKVPKGSGSLKIPSWWSSKENPPPRTASASAVASAGSAAPAAPPPPAEAGAPQARLFHPPPSYAPPTATPTIRPPSVTVRRPVSTPVKAASMAAPAVAAPEPGQAGAAVAPPGESAAKGAESTAPSAAPPRVFAPMTVPRDAQPAWSPGRAASATGVTGVPGVPRWAVLGGAAGVVVIVGCVVVMLINRPKPTQGQMARNPAPTIENSAPRGLLPPPGSAGSAVRPAPVTAPVAPAGLSEAPGSAGQTPASPSRAGVGKVNKPGTVVRNSGQYYIVIAQTPDESITYRNADFLAQNGIDVSVEIIVRNGRVPMYALVSVAGFASVEAAEPYRRKIVEVGHLLPEYKRTHKAWDDAYADQVRSPGGGAAR